MDQLSDYLKLVLELNDQPKIIPEQIDQYKKQDKKQNKSFNKAPRFKVEKKGSKKELNNLKFKTEFPLIRNSSEFSCNRRNFQGYESIWTGTKDSSKTFL